MWCIPSSRPVYEAQKLHMLVIEGAVRSHWQNVVWSFTSTWCAQRYTKQMLCSGFSRVILPSCFWKRAECWYSRSCLESYNNSLPLNRDIFAERPLLLRGPKMMWQPISRFHRQCTDVWLAMSIRRCRSSIWHNHANAARCQYEKIQDKKIQWDEDWKKFMQSTIIRGDPIRLLASLLQMWCVWTD